MNEDDENTLAKTHPLVMKTPAIRGMLAGLVFVILALPLLIGLLINTNGEPGPHEFTKVTLRGAMAAIIEFEVSENRMIDHKTAARPLPMNSGKHTGSAIPDSNVEWIVAELWAIERCRKALQSLGKDALADTDGDGFLEILDGWGNPLIYVKGVSHSDHFKYDDFLAECKVPCLISAGADGHFGDVRDPGNKWIKDNMYSVTYD